MKTALSNCGGGSRRARVRGFTLVEILVVVLIIGLGVGLVSFSVGDNTGKILRSNVRQLANHAALISEEALLSGRQWGIDIFQDTDDSGDARYGYRWLMLEEKRWLPVQPRDMAVEQLFPPGIGLTFELEGVEQEIRFKEAVPEKDDGKFRLEPDILLLSSGEVTAFVLTFSEGEETFGGTDDGAIRLRADLIGRIEVTYGDDES